MDLFTDTTAILKSFASNRYYGMLRGKIHTNLPFEHTTIANLVPRVLSYYQNLVSVLSASAFGFGR